MTLMLLITSTSLSSDVSSSLGLSRLSTLDSRLSTLEAVVTKIKKLQTAHADEAACQPTHPPATPRAR